MKKTDLIRKYNVPGPRYTSYPAVPFWKDQGHYQEQWLENSRNAFWLNGKELSLYLHMPFCESLCTYCGCSTHITRNHDVEDDYMKMLLKEWSIYLNEFSGKPTLKELHLGGGTPTFFSEKNLNILISKILDDCEISEDCSLSFEGHPGNTSQAHLKTLNDLGFNRVSFGIQDFDFTVQKVINRKQSYEQIENVTSIARQLGYRVNYDLVYGLPAQNLSTISDTIEKTIAFQPDRIAYYGYAHVPTMKPAQKSFEHLLPVPENRYRMYELGKVLFSGAGYEDIGMDHFALPEDDILKAKEEGRLHRNFMGYTTQKTGLLMGLGMSAISDSWTAFWQNEKTIKGYYSKLEQGQLPTFRGHQLSTQDLYIRKTILDIMCNYAATIDKDDLEDLNVPVNWKVLTTMEKDNLIEWNSDKLLITKKGVPHVRNVCMAFDANLSKESKSKNFSKTI